MTDQQPSSPGVYVATRDACGVPFAESPPGVQVRISCRTRPLLDRFLNSPESAGPARRLLADEVLRALGNDMRVLADLRTALEGREAGDLPMALVSQSIERCDDLKTECSVAAAQVALACGMAEQAAALMVELRRRPGGASGDGLAPLIVTLCLSAAWMVQDISTALTLLDTASRFDPQGQHRAFLGDYGRLLMARFDMRNRRTEAAIRECSGMANADHVTPALRIPALELMADGFREMGDARREKDALERWTGLLTHLRNGPCELAASMESAAPGILRESRPEEILVHYSRLARLYEPSPTTNGAGQEIYQRFMNMAYHAWRDPDAPQLGTLQERAARLADRGTAPGQPTVSTRVAIVDPDRTYNQISESALAALMANVRGMAASGPCAIVIEHAEMMEREFSYTARHGGPFDQLYRDLRTICRTDPAFPFVPTRRPVLWKGCEMEWLSLGHRETAPHVRSIFFGLQVTPVLRDRFDVSVFLLLDVGDIPPETLDRFVQELLTTRPEALGGYVPLRTRAVNLVKSAAQRVGQRIVPAHPGGAGSAAHRRIAT